MIGEIPKDIQPILDDVKKQLRAVYGDQLRDIVLYGSFARGDFTSGSDIDLILVLEEMTDPSLERERYFEAIWELDLKYDTLISIIPISETDYRTRRLPLILNAKKEGISI